MGRDRDKLSNAKNEAIEYIKHQLQLWKLQGVTKQILLNKYNNKKEAIHAQQQQLEIKQSMEDIEVQYQGIRNQKNKIEKEVKKHQDMFQELDQNDVSLAERLKYLKKEIKKTQKNRNNLEKEREEFTKTIENNKRLIPKLDEEREEIEIELESESKKQQNMMTQLTEKTQGIKEKMEEKQKELIPLKDRENSIKQQLNIINNMIQSINNKVSDAQKRKQNVEDRINDINQNINNCKQQLLQREQFEEEQKKTNKSLLKKL